VDRRTDRRTDVTKLIIAFRNFAKASKKGTPDIKVNRNVKRYSPTRWYLSSKLHGVTFQNTVIPRFTVVRTLNLTPRYNVGFQRDREKRFVYYRCQLHLREMNE
jgi:hypothetical protein